VIRKPEFRIAFGGAGSGFFIFFAEA